MANRSIQDALVIQNLYDALKAADYYIEQLERMLNGKTYVIRDVAEAKTYYENRGPVVLAAMEREF